MPKRTLYEVLDAAYLAADSGNTDLIRELMKEAVDLAWQVRRRIELVYENTH